MIGALIAGRPRCFWRLLKDELNRKRLRPNVPVILLSGNSAPPEGAEKADTFICKGEGPEVLLNRVSGLLASATEERTHAEIQTAQLTALSRERLASIVESIIYG